MKSCSTTSNTLNGRWQKYKARISCSESSLPIFREPTKMLWMIIGGPSASARLTRSDRMSGRRPATRKILYVITGNDRDRRLSLYGIDTSLEVVQLADWVCVDFSVASSSLADCRQLCLSDQLVCSLIVDFLLASVHDIFDLLSHDVSSLHLCLEHG